MNLAPIALFTFNRPWHTKQTIEALQKNFLAKDSDLFIFCDGPRNLEDEQKVKEVGDYLTTINGFKSIIIKKSSKNKGLANSIIDGVSEIVNKFGKIIVLEDDLVTSPYFLEFMNDGLNFYKNEEKVISIHGYIYPVKKSLPETFFLRGADCWGWATWNRGWKLFNENGQQLLDQLKKRKLCKKFNFDNCYPYSKMLEDQINGKNDSWAIRWHASAFLNDKLTLYPGNSLLQNIGIDGSGTHCGNQNESNNDKVYFDKIKIIKIELKESEKARKAIKNFFKPKKGILEKIKAKIHKKINKKKLKKKQKEFGWFSTNLEWNDIIKKYGGYDDKVILEKCKNSLLKVKNCQALYERDSVIFDKIEYSWPILSALMMIASENNNQLNIVDFGGSLGSTYYQNRKFLENLKSVKWNIIEQDKFVECGKKNFSDNKLNFFHSINESLNVVKSNALLLSSVIQYLKEPHKFLEEIIKFKFDYILIDRTGFINENFDKLTIQKVPPSIYRACYPCWFFNKELFLANLKNSYSLIEEFDSHFDKNILIDHKTPTEYKGFILKLKKNA